MPSINSGMQSYANIEPLFFKQYCCDISVLLIDPVSFQEILHAIPNIFHYLLYLIDWNKVINA